MRGNIDRRGLGGLRKGDIDRPPDRIGVIAGRDIPGVLRLLRGRIHGDGRNFPIGFRGRGAYDQNSVKGGAVHDGGGNFDVNRTNSFQVGTH